MPVRSSSPESILYGQLSRRQTNTVAADLSEIEPDVSTDQLETDFVWYPLQTQQIKRRFYEQQRKLQEARMLQLENTIEELELRKNA